MPIKAADILTVDRITVDENDPVLDVAERMLANGISSVPVVCREGSQEVLVGILSEHDILRGLAAGYLHRDPALKADDLMQRHPDCVGRETGIRELAELLMRRGRRHLPVVDGRFLAGVVSRRDVLRALVEQQAEGARVSDGRPEPAQFQAVGPKP